ncbi:MAG: Crp/Fnr family transcriptional regulator [Bacillota bacterium]
MNTEATWSMDFSVKEIPLFSELDDQQLELINNICKTVQFKKHDTIFLSGNAYKGFYVVLKGKVKIYRLSASGKETILHIIKPVNMFADVPLFEGKCYPVNAETLEESVLLFIPKKEFIDLLESNVKICMKMLAGFAKRLKFLTQRLDELSNKEVTSRLAEYLIGEIEKGGKMVSTEPVLRLNDSKRTIASYLGTITETISRSFRKLQDDNIIKIEGRKIFIKDYPALKKLAEK